MFNLLLQSTIVIFCDSLRIYFFHDVGAGWKVGMGSDFTGRNSVSFHSCSAGLHVLSLHACYVLDRRSSGLESEHGDFIAAVLDLLFLFNLWGDFLSGLYKKAEYYIF